jgi:hypothetical protein
MPQPDFALWPARSRRLATWSGSGLSILDAICLWISPARKSSLQLLFLLAMQIKCLKDQL